MFPIDRKTFDEAVAECGILDLGSATIRQIVGLSHRLEEIAGDTCVHLEMGNPGLPPSRVGIEAEVRALRSGVSGRYPDINGIPELKRAGARFVKAFEDVDLDERWIVPTVGSMQGCFTTLLLMGQRIPGRDTILFLNPGFPAQHHQAKVLGLKEISFDIYDYRGAALEAKLEECLSSGRVSAILYSNPNNPAWTNLTPQELEILGRMADKHDAIVIEDQAYFAMDFRTDFSHPFRAPYPPTIAHYTDNYILMLSGSKIFSYAGQRIALVCMSPAVAERRYDYLRDFYGMERYGDAYIYGVLYVASSGTAHSAQFAMAAMLDAAADGTLDFVGTCRDYGVRASRARQAFTGNGFHLVYDHDGDSPISDGFFFTVGYGDMDSVTLQRELLKHGVATISLPSTGSKQNGVRVCVSMLTDESDFENLERHLATFAAEHGAAETACQPAMADECCHN